MRYGPTALVLSALWIVLAALPAEARQLAGPSGAAPVVTAGRGVLDPWARSFDPPSSGGTGSATAVVSDGSGGSFVVGNSGSLRLWVARLDASGRPLWEHELAHNGQFPFVSPPSIAVHGSDVFVTAYFVRTLGIATLLVAKLTDAGQVVWKRALIGDDGPPVSTPLYPSFPGVAGFDPHVVATQDGGACVAFVSNVGSAGYTQLVRYSAAGAVLWTRWVTLGSATSSSLYDAVSTQDGGFLLLLNSNNGRETPQLCKIDDTGSAVWSSTYTPVTTLFDYSLPRGVDVAPDGGSVVTGGSPSQPLFYAFRVDATGAVVWSRRWDGTPGPAEFSVADVTSTSDNGCVVLGEVLDTVSGVRDLWLAHLSATGSLRWSRGLGGLGTERGLGIDRVEGSEDLRVVGTTSGSFAVSGAWTLGIPPTLVPFFDPASGAMLRARPLPLVDAPLTRSNGFALVTPAAIHSVDTGIQLLPVASASALQTP